jgi:hypothetical protein
MGTQLLILLAMIVVAVTSIGGPLTVLSVSLEALVAIGEQKWPRCERRSREGSRGVALILGGRSLILIASS